MCEQPSNVSQVRIYNVTHVSPHSRTPPWWTKNGLNLGIYRKGGKAPRRVSGFTKHWNWHFLFQSSTQNTTPRAKYERRPHIESRMTGIGYTDHSGGSRLRAQTPPLRGGDDLHIDGAIWQRACLQFQSTDTMHFVHHTGSLFVECLVSANSLTDRERVFTCLLGDEVIFDSATAILLYNFSTLSLVHVEVSKTVVAFGTQ